MAGIEILRAQDAQLLLEDKASERRIELGGGTLEFRRKTGPGEIDARIGVGADGRAGRLDAQIRRLADPERYRLHIRVDSLVPFATAVGGPDAGPAGRQLVVDGSLDASLTADGHPSPATFALRSRPTKLSLPDELSAPVPLGPIEVAGSIDPKAEILHIERATAAVAGSKLAGSGQIALASDARGAEGKATVSFVGLGELLSMWPKHLAADAHHWVAQNLSAGTVDRAGIQVKWQAAQANRRRGSI